MSLFQRSAMASSCSVECERLRVHIFVEGSSLPMRLAGTSRLGVNRVIRETTQ